jgi:hypothetical protein
MNVKVEINAKSLKNRNIRTTSDFTERHQMLKYMLGGAFATLAIIKLCELVDHQPRIGIPLVAVMTFAWMIELFRELKKAKR